MQERRATPESVASTEGLSILRPMPRRKTSHGIEEIQVALPRARRVYFSPGIIRPIGRLLFWLWGAIRFVSANMLDVVLRRDTIQRRAVRLRHLFETGGATFAKFGQQLSIRADVLPYAYCAELSRMLDQAPAFPTSEAIAIIERNLGKPLSEVFEVFDPDPIGSASLSCVYQARLRTGERVAVKVRRPGIGPLIAADLRALDWLLIAAETLTIIPPGMTRAFRQDLQTILFRELNFRTEARYTDLFRRRSLKRGTEVTAPLVYFQYCTEEVLVSEFVSGFWIWEIMAAVDNNDQEFLLELSEQGIDPKKLASKLVLIMNREVQEELFFHSDPHPANIVVMPDNKICFIDFGAIGRFTTQSRKTFRELSHHMLTGDVGRMVNASIGLAEPLPPVDIEMLRKELEIICADWVYAQRSKDAEWWERSGAQVWLRYMEIARRYQLPLSFETVQFFRASFSYDAICNRLNKQLDFSTEYKAYLRQSSREARRRVQRKIRSRLGGPTNMDYLEFEQLVDMINQFLFQVQRNLEHPVVHFKNIIGKLAYIARLLLRAGYFVAAGLAVGLLADSFSKRWFGHGVDWPAIVERATSFGWPQLLLLAIALVIVRRIVIRLGMPDSKLNADRL
jgi:ubiquinone biosynthesis protein